MDRRQFIACLLGLVTLFAVSNSLISAEPSGAAKIQWKGDFFEAHKLAVQTGKPMLLVFGADWCHFCKKLEKKTLSHPQLAEYINRSFIPVHLDLDNPQDKKIAKILEVRPIPCSILLSPQADLLGRSVGFTDVNGYYKTLENGRRLQARIERAEYKLVSDER